MTDPLAGVSLADALDDYLDRLGRHPDADHLADVVWAWFRANRDTLCEEVDYFIQPGYFDEMLDAAQALGAVQRTPRP